MTYADNFNIRTTTVKYADVASALDGLLVGGERIYGSSLFSTTSSAYVDVTGISRSATLATGEMALILLSISLSNSSATGQALVALYRDSTKLVERTVDFKHSDSNGQELHLSLQYLDFPGVGTFTFRPRLSSVGGSNTVYTKYQDLHVITLQNT